MMQQEGTMILYRLPGCGHCLEKMLSFFNHLFWHHLHGRYNICFRSNQHLQESVITLSLLWQLPTSILHSERKPLLSMMHDHNMWHTLDGSTQSHFFLQKQGTRYLRKSVCSHTSVIVYFHIIPQECCVAAIYIHSNVSCGMAVGGCDLARKFNFLDVSHCGLPSDWELWQSFGATGRLGFNCF